MPICLNVLNNPKSCSSKNTSHSFCKKCLDTYLKAKNTCPICKNQFNYKINYRIESILINTKFKCKNNNYGCKTILNYYQYFKHINPIPIPTPQMILISFNLLNYSRNY